MTKKRKIFITIASIALTVALVAGVSAIAASKYGTASDPFVSLSYLTETLTPSLKSQFQGLLDTSKNTMTTYIDNQINALKNQNGGGSGGESSYKVVTLSNGQTITGSVGCEIILRVGTAQCTGSSSPGLVNSTAGNTIDSGTALVKNNVYIVSIEGNGIKATDATVKVLIRGTYTIK